MMKILALSLCILTLVACNTKKKDKDDVIVVTAPDELLPFVGRWAKCQAVTGKGSDFNSTGSYSIEFVIKADATFTHNRWYYGDSATCTGSENVISWTENGNVAVVRDSSSVVGAKEISFDRTSSSLTARDYGSPKLFKTHFPIYFNPINYLGGTGTMDNPVAIWASGTNIIMGDFQVNNGNTYNTISVSGTTMSMKEPLDWHMGLISAPASQGFNLTKF